MIYIKKQIKSFIRQINRIKNDYIVNFIFLFFILLYKDIKL